jgi:ketosteroid isomerase-like protein
MLIEQRIRPVFDALVLVHVGRIGAGTGEPEWDRHLAMGPLRFACQAGYCRSVSRENVEVVRAIYHAYERGEFGLEHFHEDVEWFGPPDISGGGLWRGHEGVRRALTQWVGTWDDYRFELRDLIDSGDHVVGRGWQSGRGKGSGVEVSEEIFSVFTLRAGKVVRQRMFRDKAEALEAVGLRE